MSGATFVQAFEEGVVVNLSIDASGSPADDDEILVPVQFNDASGHVLDDGFYFLAKNDTVTLKYDGSSYKGQYAKQQDSFLTSGDAIDIKVNRLQYGAEYSLTVGTNSTVNATSANLFLASKLQNAKIVNIIEGDNKLEAKVEYDLASINSFNKTLASSGMQVSVENVTPGEYGSATFDLDASSVVYEDNASATKGVISVLISGTDANGDNKVYNNNNYIISVSIGNRMGLQNLTQSKANGAPIVVTPVPTPNGLSFSNYDSVTGLLSFILDAETDALNSYATMRVDFEFSKNGSVVGTQTMNLAKTAGAQNSYPSSILANNGRSVTVNDAIISKLKVVGSIEKFSVKGTVVGTQQSTIDGNPVTETFISNDVATKEFFQEGGLKVDSFKLFSVDLLPYDTLSGNFVMNNWGKQTFHLVIDGSHNIDSLQATFDLSGAFYTGSTTVTNNGVIVNEEENKTVVDFTLTYDQVLLGDGQTLSVNVSRYELNDPSNSLVRIATDGTKSADASGNFLFRNDVNLNAIPIYAVRGPGQPAVSFVEPTLGVDSKETTASVTFEEWNNQDNTSDGIKQLDASNIVYYGAEIRESNSSDDGLYDVKLSNAVVPNLTSKDLVFEFSNVYSAGTKYTLSGFGYKKLSEILANKNTYSIDMYRNLNIFGEALNQNKDILPGIKTSVSTVFKGRPEIQSITPVPLDCNSLQLNALRIKGDMNANVMNKILALAMDVSGRILEREFPIDSTSVDIGMNPMTGDGSNAEDDVAGDFTFIADMSGSTLSVDQQLTREIAIDDNIFIFALADTENFLDGYRVVNGVEQDGLANSRSFRNAANAFVTASNEYHQAVFDAGVTDGTPNYITQTWYTAKTAEIGNIDSSIATISGEILTANNTLEGNTATNGSNAALQNAEDELKAASSSISAAEFNKTLYTTWLGYWNEIVAWIDNSGGEIRGVDGWGKGNVATPADALKIFGELVVPGLTHPVTGNSVTISEMRDVLEIKVGEVEKAGYVNYESNNRRRLLNVHTMVFYEPRLPKATYGALSTVEILNGSTKIASENLPDGNGGTLVELYTKIEWTAAEMLSPLLNTTVLASRTSTYETALTTAKTGYTAKYQAVDTQRALNKALKADISANTGLIDKKKEEKVVLQEALQEIIDKLDQTKDEKEKAYQDASGNLVANRKLFFEYDVSGNCLGHKGMAPIGSGGPGGQHT